MYCGTNKRTDNLQISDNSQQQNFGANKTNTSAGGVSPQVNINAQALTKAFINAGAGNIQQGNYIAYFLIFMYINFLFLVP